MWHVGIRWYAVAIGFPAFLFFVGDQITQWWLVGTGFVVVAIIVPLVEGPNFERNASTLHLEPQRAAQA